MSMGLGEGTNNYAELLSLKILLMSALEKGCRNLSFFGDSLNVINWVNDTQRCRAIGLSNILDIIKEVLILFDSFQCHHVFRENNKEADRASKEGTRMAQGTWLIKEHKDGDQVHEFYHEPFIV